VTDDGDPTAFK